MRWVRPLSATLDEPVEAIGAKAHGLVTLHRLGLPVPAAFVVTTAACRAFLREGRLPPGLSAELSAAVGHLGTVPGGLAVPDDGTSDPLLVSVRSGAATSMPGMMDTILNLAPTGDALDRAVEVVFSSWDSDRARTYRELNGIAHDAGTAVVVQTMVLGDRDEHSGSGVAFSRDPTTGRHVPYGDVLFGHQGDDVVAGTTVTRPLDELRTREPAVWTGLLDALTRAEEHFRDACYMEFTYESGELWLLQVRPGRFTGAAAVRLATDLADSGVISRDEALARVTPQHLADARTPRIGPSGQGAVLARGIGACPGVGVGRVATTTEAAVRLAADGPVILVRPETSPHDMQGLAVAAGVVTARGGPASHAAVVARSMGTPAVVGVTALRFADGTGADGGADDGTVEIAGRTLTEGTVVTIDGTGGEVALGAVPVVTDAADASVQRLLAWAEEAGER